jgi:hypothetical protein
LPRCCSRLQSPVTSRSIERADRVQPMVGGCAE